MKGETQIHDLALAYILTSISHNGKVAVHQMRYLAEVWIKLKTMFQAVSEAAVDSKLLALLNIFLGKGEKIFEYWNRIPELVTELECVRQDTSKSKQKCALLRGYRQSFM